MPLSRTIGPAAALALLYSATASEAQFGGRREEFVRRFVGRAAPAFALKDLAGQTVRLADERGRVVLLNFWFSTCGPCRMETPDLVALYRTYRERGLQVIGINLDDLVIPGTQEIPLREFLREFRMPYPILKGDLKTFQAYGSAPIQPISFLVDREGIVRRVFWGAYPGAAFERALLPLLKPAAPPKDRPGTGAVPAGP